MRAGHRWRRDTRFKGEYCSMSYADWCVLLHMYYRILRLFLVLVLLCDSILYIMCAIACLFMVQSYLIHSKI